MKTRELAFELAHTFDWPATPQGFGYWNQVWNNLMNLDEKAPPPVQEQIDALRLRIEKLEQRDES